MASAAVVDVEVPCPLCGEIIACQIRVSQPVAGTTQRTFGLAYRDPCIHESDTETDHGPISDEAFVAVARSALAQLD
jgi:hypothetical protein